MNTGSKLDISKSSLLSLQAELARKREEAAKSKAQAQGNYIKPLAKPAKNSIFSRSNAGLENRQANDVHDLAPDEESKINKSRSILEKKAKLYDSLSKNSSNHEQSDYLVDFSGKASDDRQSYGRDSPDDAEERRRREKEEEEEEARRADSDEYDAPSDPEDDWVDFKDSLGRTRRCLRRDLSRFRELDDRLLKSLEPKTPTVERESPPPGPSPPAGLPAGCAAPDLLSDDMRREQQRLKWEEEEQNLRDKSDIHYQDVLFEEARTHGVGYFPFSRDESVRRTQQDDLKKLRKETEAKQKAALTQRERRQQLLNARLRAAHNRKRAREGLPPLGEDEELPGAKTEEAEQVEEPEPTPVPTVQRASGPRPRPSPAIRPWDIGKEGVPVLTQSEWNDKQRAERKKEFAPPSFYEDRQGDRQGAERRDRQPDRRRRRDRDDDDIGPPAPSSSPPPGPAPPPSPPPGPVPAPVPAPDLSWMSVPPPAKRPKRDWRAAQAAQEVRLPMEEEEDFSEEPPPPGVTEPPSPPAPRRREEKKKGGSDAGRVGAEIAPPPTIEYFGPSESAAERSRRAGQGGGQGDLSAAISAGLRYLREESEKKERKRTDKGWADFM
ncbi:coiled-coil domain-containing protein 174 [Thrips palmi]|uniref:Coiled-coil domain-containing protein 174 n=1 Tax=Thrips palmi TaxID=161013 RepID=A0A6P9A6V4_THRPL|nr:coiled-coil domain-containing protein 174 [Thrips palmi]